jgi:alpha-amylase/alpha-mannosidase (GH57 family)
MVKKLYINFLWHMHQPYYRKIKTKNTLMPWVRLHTIKSYYDMPKIIENFSEIKVNFNIVPSLLKQIDEYAHGKEDDYLKLSRISPSDLTNRQKKFINENFFQANLEKMINPYSRYRELKNKHIDEYSNQDFLDLQVWFNLTWFGQWFKDNNAFVKELIEKGKDFSELEKKQLLNLQLKILKEIKTIYLNLLKHKKIELSTTPFYHPIIPLLIDSGVAHECMPYAELPKTSFKFQEDAQWHIDESKKMHLESFKEKPTGIWPAEGAVSNDTLDLFIKNKFKWTASDEDILRKSLNNWDNNSLYQPYFYSNNSGNIAVIFRNHELSDLIGFVYQKWHYEDAVNDFISRLKDIKNKITSDYGLVSIIMDGENAWEYYTNNGWDFLTCLYEKIINEKDLDLIFSRKKIKENISRFMD